MAAAVCNERGCGRLVRSPKSKPAYCSDHAWIPLARKRLRDSQDPRAAARMRIYKSARWARTRQLVLARYDYQCVDCGATEEERTLFVDHIDGVLEAANPFDPDGCQVLCAVCSGKKDGGRRPSQASQGGGAS